MEECGVFGIYDLDGADVVSTIYYGFCPAAQGAVGELRASQSAMEDPREGFHKGMGLAMKQLYRLSGADARK